MPAVREESIRGLSIFISDIRNSKSKEAENKRVNKELANIRFKFNSERPLDGYQKKKYVCKLLYIFLLGYDIDIGKREAINLLSSNKYSEKRIGYLFISVMINSDNEFMPLIIQLIKSDLFSQNPIYVNLALQCITNFESKDVVEAFVAHVSEILVSVETVDFVKQNAALCLLHLVRTMPNIEIGKERISSIAYLLKEENMGLVLSVVSLLDELVKINSDEFKICIPLTVSKLNQLVIGAYPENQDYTYYNVHSPWLCVKLLKFLQNLPLPEDEKVKKDIRECLENILISKRCIPSLRKVQHINATNAVLFEAFNLIIHMNSDHLLLLKVCDQLGPFLTCREDNLKLMALQCMNRLAASEYFHKSLQKHHHSIIKLLNTDIEPSVRYCTFDLLFTMCDKYNAEKVIKNMLACLEIGDCSMKEELVLKIAILAEKFSSDYEWYIDVILNLIQIAGDYVSEEVWYRLIQIVTNRNDIKGYAAMKVFEHIQSPICHEKMVIVSGYILGEFGNLIAGTTISSPLIQFRLLHSKYKHCTTATRALLLTTFIKFINLYPEIKSEVQFVLNSDCNIRNSDAELQQRSMEYLKLSSIGTADVLATILDEMPPFPEKESLSKRNQM